MSYMWVAVKGLGYNEFSAGKLKIIVEHGGIYYYYETLCQGVSTSRFGADEFFEIKNDVSSADESVLQNLCSTNIKVEIPDIFVIQGTIEMNFEVYSSDANTSEALYKCTRRFSAKGSSFGDVKILTNIDSHPVGLSYENANIVRSMTMSEVSPF
jgi:hypothetical protein